MNIILKKIAVKGGFLLFPFFAYYICYDAYLIHTGNFSNDGSLIYHAIDKSKKKVDKKKIIFGDSVGGQLYLNTQDNGRNYYSLTTSGPSSLVGIYVMLENFIKVNDTEGCVFYYVIIPVSLNEQLHDKGTYNHFVKPFYTLENFKCFSPSVHEVIRSFPYWYAAQIPFIKISNWEPEFEVNSEYRLTISPIYIDYLKRIDSLANQYHFRFTAVMPFLKEGAQNTDFSEIKQLIKQNGIENIFATYFENIRYLPIEQFHYSSNHYLKPEELGENPLNL